MVDTSKCFSLIRGRAMRVTRLDGCGAVVNGPDSVVVTDGFITVGLTAQTDEGTAISVTNAAGKVCISDEPCPLFTGYDVQVEFCGVNPDLVRLMTGMPMVQDSGTPSQGVGFRMNTGVDACDSGFALELWSNVPTAACEPGTGVSYGYFLVPFLKGGIIGDFTIQNDAINFTLTGAKSKDGSGWAKGPYNVVAGVGGVAAPLLTAIDDEDHLHMQLTTIAPPTELCGAQSLGVAATTATAPAGTTTGPATLTPTNGYTPANLAGANGPPITPTASPATAWTVGQYITFRDGSKGRWSGTAWVAG
jgi:hypothetical protein